MITRRQLLRGAAAGIGAAAAGPRLAPLAAQATDPKDNTRRRSNVIVILVDDLGYGDLSSYGAKDMRTPNIDALMAAGMRFSRFYANSCVCSPTRAALLTGRYPPLVGVPGVIRSPNDRNGRLLPRAALLPRVLEKADFVTACIGKWHLGLCSPDLPNDHRFGYFHGFLGDMMDDYYTHRRIKKNYMRRNEETIDPEGHATDLFTQWAVDYIRIRAGGGGNFFLYLAYNAPHTPIQPPLDWLAKVKRREPKMSDRRARLVALIEHLDHGIGQVMAALRESGLADETLVFFTSDNGGQLSVGANNGELRGGKCSLYEGGIRVPACAVWPGQIQPGSRTDHVALTMDIFPTVAEATWTKVEHAMDGWSFLPTLLGKKQPTEKRPLFFNYFEGGRRRAEAVRRGDWKLLRYWDREPRIELYNLADDPKESRNLVDDPNARKQLDALSLAMVDYIARSDAVPWRRAER